MSEWEKLVKILERNKAYSAFVAECVYAYIVNYSFETQADKRFAGELVNFIDGVSNES